MAINLAKELLDVGYELPADDYRVTVLEVFQGLFPDWTDEELLYHPDKAMRFCGAVAQETGVSLADHVVLRTLVNCRKRGFGVDPTT